MEIVICDWRPGSVAPVLNASNGVIEKKPSRSNYYNNSDKPYEYLTGVAVCEGCHRGEASHHKRRQAKVQRTANPLFNNGHSETLGAIPVRVVSLGDGTTCGPNLIEPCQSSTTLRDRPRGFSKTDCEYPWCSSANLLGCVSVTTSVTQILIGRVPLLGLVRSWSPAPARSECWPD